MMKAKERKAKELEEIKNLISKYNTISIADLTSLPSSTLQKLRKKLQDKMFIKVTKKSLISLALEVENAVVLDTEFKVEENKVQGHFLFLPEPEGLENILKALNV